MPLAFLPYAIIIGGAVWLVLNPILHALLNL